MSDDANAFDRRCATIAEIEAAAIQGAKNAPRLRSAWALERLEATIEAAHAGRLTLSPQARAIADRIEKIVDRIAIERGWPQLK
jgi:hypothetical protein